MSGIIMNRRRRLLSASVAILAALPVPALAQAQTFQFNIEAQSLDGALRAFARTTRRPVLFDGKLVKGKTSPGLKGSHSAENGLAILLAASGLRATMGSRGAFVIKPQELAANGEGRAPQTVRAGESAAGLDDTQPAGDIIVTGSRLDQGHQRSPTPVLSLGSAEIEVAAQPQISDLINRLPSARPSLTPISTTNLAPSLGNFLDLRGLGATRTLVLLDGQRIVPALLTGAVDVAQIPQALINGVDVVTGGASAAWGSDAVAGVVNFRTNNRLEGVKGDIQGGITSHNDNKNYLASLAYGTKFADGRGHIVVAGEYFHNQGTNGEFLYRDWTRAGWVLFGNPNFTATNAEPQFLLLPNVNFITSSAGGLIANTALRGIDFIGPGAVPTLIATGTLRTASTQVGGGGTPSLSTRVPISDRRSAYGAVEYEFGPALTVRASASWAQSRNVQNTASVSNVTIQRANPYLPESIAAQMDAAGIASFTLGRRYDEFNTPIIVDSRQQRYALAAFGELGGGWRWDAYYTYGATDRRLTVNNLTLAANVNNAANAIRDPVTGQPICASAAARAAGCQPANFFGTGNISPAAIDYMFGSSVHDVTIKEHAAAVTLRGEPIELWAGPVAVAVGGEYRSDSGKLLPNAQSGASLFSSYNFTGYSAKSHVAEMFGEIALPLLRDLPGAERVDVDLAARYTDYSVSGGVTTWKAGMTWDVLRGFRVRASESRDIRAPSLQELFAGGATTFLNITDPVTGGIYPVSQASVGNPRLTPEVSKTFTAGVVIEPPFAPGLRLSVDYFDISMSNAIISLTPQTIVTRCYSDAPQACSLIVRDPVSNLITSVDNSPVNLQRVFTNGIDIDLSYNHRLGAGTLSLRGLVTLVDKVIVDDGRSKVDYAATVAQPSINSIGGVPHWRFMGTARYEIGRVNVGAGLRYMGGGKIDPIATSPKVVNIMSVKGQTLVDLDASYDLLGDGRFKLFAVVNNVFDTDPPITGVATATTRGLYEVLGRNFISGIRLKF